MKNGQGWGGWWVEANLWVPNFFTPGDGYYVWKSGESWFSLREVPYWGS